MARAAAVTRPRAGSASWIGACEHVHCSSPPPPRRAPAQPAPAVTVRHGKCSLHLSIGGTRYRLHPITPPAGFQALWSLRKQSPESSAVYQVAVEKGQAPACTCPDFEINGAVCKHIGALKALGLIPGRKARPAAARRSHARRLAEPAPAPAPAGPLPAGPFAAGFRSAVARGSRRPPRRAGRGGELSPLRRLRRGVRSRRLPRPAFLRPLRRGRGLQMINTSSLFLDRAGAHPARPHPPGRVPLRRGIRRLSRGRSSSTTRRPVRPWPT